VRPPDEGGGTVGRDGADGFGAAEGVLIVPPGLIAGVALLPEGATRGAGVERPEENERPEGELRPDEKLRPPDEPPFCAAASPAGLARRAIASKIGPSHRFFIGQLATPGVSCRIIMRRRGPSVQRNPDPGARGAAMIFGKIWRAIRAQFNKLANWFSSKDPVAQMQYEYDSAVEQMREGRVGLEQYRALVERVTRQVATNKAHANNLEAKVKAYLANNDRETAARFAVELQKARKELAENEAQLKMHEEAYTNNLTKIKHASGKLAELKNKISKYDADLKMSRAEAEMAKLANNFNFNVTTDFGQMEQVIQDQISLNRAKARVASDLSSEGLDEIKAEQDLEKATAEQTLRELEREMGLATPETTAVKPTEKELGPAKKQKQKA
jgi:phage shock protein A